MTKVSSIKNSKYTKKIPPPIDVKVRTKKRKKRKDLEQLRKSVLDARQDLRRERRLVGGLKYKGPSNVLDKTLRDFADIREENEIKTQGISNKGENKRILCTRLMHEPTIGLFKKGAKGNEVKRRVDITLSDAADARLRGDVIRLLNGDNTSPRNNNNNERKIIQEEKIISKQVKPVHASPEESEKTPSPVSLHRTKWISKDKNAKNLKKKDDNCNRRLFEIDDDDDDDNSNDFNTNKNLPCMDSLEFSPKASRVDESDSIDVPNDLNRHKKLPKLNDCSSSLNRWRWSPATCFEEYCSIVCVGTFTNFIDNCTAEDPVERIRNELMATYKEVRGQQKNDDNSYHVNEQPEVTPQFSDSSAITCEVVGHHGSHNKVMLKSSTASSLATTVLTDGRNDVIDVPELKRYFKNLDNKVTPQNKMVKQTDGKNVRVSLQQPFKTPKNSQDVSTSIDMTRNKNDKYSKKKNTERPNHIPFQNKVYYDRTNEFHQEHSPELLSSNIQENEFNNNFIEKKNNFDAISEYSIDKGYAHQVVPSPSLGWSASHEAKIVQLPPSFAKHIPHILRRSTNNKTVHFNLDLTNHQRRIKNNLSNQFNDNIKQKNLNNPLKMKFDGSIFPSDIFTQNNQMDYSNDYDYGNLYENNNHDKYENKKNYKIIKTDNNIPIQNNYYVAQNLKPSKKFSCDPNDEVMKRVISIENPQYDRQKLHKKNNSDSHESEYNDAILRGFKVLSCSEVERSKAKFTERGKISGHFLSNQPTKYLAISEENDKSLVPRRVPVYHNTKKIENKNFNDTLAYSDIYKKSNRVLTPPLVKIYPQKYESISFDNSLLSNANLHNNEKYLHRDLFNQDHSKKIQHRQHLYEIDHADRHKAQTFNYFAPINSYEENSREVKCFGNLCEKKNCHECFQAKLQNTIRKF